MKKIGGEALLATTLAEITQLTGALQTATPDSFSTTHLTRLEKLKEKALDQGGNPIEIARAGLLGMPSDGQQRYFQNLKRKHLSKERAFLTPEELADLEKEFSNKD